MAKKVLKPAAGKSATASRRSAAPARPAAKLAGRSAAAPSRSAKAAPPRPANGSARPTDARRGVNGKPLLAKPRPAAPVTPVATGKLARAAAAAPVAPKLAVAAKAPAPAQPKSKAERAAALAATLAATAKADAALRKRLRREKREREALRPLVPLPPPPVTTDSKPKKNQAGLNTRELDHFRSLLLAKRRELLGDMSSMEREALQSGQGSNLSNLPVHMADMGTDNYEQEFTLGLVEKDRQLLREINQALAKIHDGTYGICEGTGKPINKQRLEIQPWAKFSVEHARALEKNMMLRR